MAGHWGYPDETVRVLSPEEVEQWSASQEIEVPAGEAMVEIKRGLFIQPRSVIAVEASDHNHSRVYTRVGTFNVPSEVHSVLDRLDCQSFPLPSPADGQED